MSVRILHGDCRDLLKTLPSASMHCVVMSPPYWGLRDYGVAGQLGMEPSLGEFIDTMVAVFREVRRVLRDDGTVFLNLGDSYFSSGPRQTGRNDVDRETPGGRGGSFRGGVRRAISCDTSDKEPEDYQASDCFCQSLYTTEFLKPKDLCGIPWRVAFALQADGWYLRQDIIWSKPNPMPESVTDRCTKAHEYIFLLSKNARYYYDAEAIAEQSSFPEGPGNVKPCKGADLNGFETRGNLHEIGPRGTRNKRSVWEVATAPFSEAHFATFPPALIEPCILAGCPEKACAKCGGPWVRQTDVAYADANRGMVGNQQKAVPPRGEMRWGEGRENHRRLNKNVSTLGFSPSCPCNAGAVPGTVLDPFGGAGTTGLVADRLGRNAIMIELNPEYAAMAERRITEDAPLFARVAAE